MARKRSAFDGHGNGADSDDFEDRAYALSVAAAMAASETREVVHTPSVKKKKTMMTSSNSYAASPMRTANTTNGGPQRTPQKRKPIAAPSVAAAVAPRPKKAAVQQLSYPNTGPPVMKKAVPAQRQRVAVAQYDDEQSDDSDSESDQYTQQQQQQQYAAYQQQQRQQQPDEEADTEQDEQDVEQEQDAEEEEISAPVVFQCGTCRSIFGDSYAFVCSNKDLLLVTLSAVTNIATAPEPTTSRDNGADFGSSFLEMLCKQCQAILGRQYLTTPRALDPLRGLYSFSTNAIASYQLGYPQLCQVENGSLELTALPTIEQIKQANGKCEKVVELLSVEKQEVMKLNEQMRQVQSLLVVVDERLHQLETQANDSEQEEDQEEARTGDDPEYYEEEGEQQQHKKQSPLARRAAGLPPPPPQQKSWL